MKAFSAAHRDRSLERLEHEEFDLVIVGGGVTGAAAARDAALRGLSVALLEKDDLAQGTSSRSSKLIHGGFRYLEQLHFKLVFESCQERALLQELAYHRVHPIEFLFPLYPETKVPLWQLDLGLTVYDLLAFYRNLKPHRRLNTEKLLARCPGLRANNLRGGCLYQDCITDDALLTIDLARSAAGHGAAIAVHTRVLELNAKGALAVDRLSGRELTVRCRSALCAAGPWSDLVPWRHQRLLRLTSGAHVALARDRLHHAHAVVIKHPRDGRVLFTLPWKDVVLIGTTDTDYEGDPDHVVATAWDVDYLLEAGNHIFPDACLTPGDVLGTFSGLRPLLDERGVAPSEVSREHAIREEEPGLFTIAGGKYTTHRRMAEEVVDRVARFLGNSAPCGTRERPLLDQSERWGSLAAVDLPEDVLADWRRRYPVEWVFIANLAAEGVEQAEALYAVRHQMALRLTDLVHRRLWLGVRDPQGASLRLESLSQTMARELGWDEGRRARELELAHQELAGSTAWRSHTLPTER